MKDEDLIKAGWFSNFPKLAINDLITEMIKMKMAYSIGDETSSNLIALAYTKLKTDSTFSGASDV